MSQLKRTPKTMKQLAEQVLDIQNACNLSGIVLSWAEAIQDLRKALHEAGLPNGTQEVNEHPINVWWASKVSHLTRYEADNWEAMSKSYDEVLKLAER